MLKNALKPINNNKNKLNSKKNLIFFISIQTTLKMSTIHGTLPSCAGYPDEIRGKIGF